MEFYWPTSIKTERWTIEQEHQREQGLNNKREMYKNQNAYHVFIRE